MAVIPNTDVDLNAEIRQVLNTAGGSVTTDVTTFFSSAANLDMWSKFKPVVSTTLFHTLAQWQSYGYLGDDGKCGLTIPTFSDVEPFKQAAQSGSGLWWTYTPPTGGKTQPMRVGDFRGYCTTAYNPTGDIVSNGLIVNNKVTFSIDVALTGTSDTNLTLSDIKIGGSNGTPLTNFYLGVYVWNSSTSFFYTSANKVGSDSDLTISVPITVAGTYKYIPFFSSVAQTTTSAQKATIVSANKPVQEIKIQSSSTLKKVEAYGAWNSANNKVVEITAWLTNATSSSVTFSGIKVELRRSTGTSAASAELVTTASYSGSVTVAAQSTTSITIPDISHSRSSSYNYWLAGYSSQTTETTYNQIEDQAPPEE